MRQVVSLVKDDQVHYALVDDDDGEMIPFAQILLPNPAAFGLHEAAVLGTNLIHAVGLNGHRRSRAAAAKLRELPAATVETPSSPPRTIPAQAITRDRLVEAIRANPGARAMEVAAAIGATSHKTKVLVQDRLKHMKTDPRVRCEMDRTVGPRGVLRWYPTETPTTTPTVIYQSDSGGDIRTPGHSKARAETPAERKRRIARESYHRNKHKHDRTTSLGEVHSDAARQAYDNADPNVTVNGTPRQRALPDPTNRVKRFIPLTDVVAVIADYPEGITARQIAERIWRSWGEDGKVPRWCTRSVENRLNQAKGDLAWRTTYRPYVLADGTESLTQKAKYFLPT